MKIECSKNCSFHRKKSQKSQKKSKQNCNLSLGNFTTVGTIFIQLMPMVLQIPALGLAKSSEVLTSLGMTKML